MPRQIMKAAVTMVLICAVMTSGCALFPAAIIPGASPYQQGLAQTDLPGLAKRPDAIDLATHVGESLGYRVSLKTPDCVILLYNPPEYRQVVAGESQSVKIFVYRQKALSTLDLPQSRDQELQKIFRKLLPPGPLKDGELHLAVYDSGAYLAGTPESVHQIMSNFETELLTWSATHDRR